MNAIIVINVFRVKDGFIIGTEGAYSKLELNELFENDSDKSCYIRTVTNVFYELKPGEGTTMEEIGI